MKRFLLVVFSALCVAAALRAQTGRQLYLLTGLATPKDNFTVPTAVYSVDQRSQTATPVAELVGPSDGSDFVQVDHDRRLIVLGSGHVKPSRLVVLSMDAPTTPRSIPTSYGDDSLIRNFLFETRDGKPMEAYYVVGSTEKRLIGFDLLAPDPTAAAQALPWEGDRYVRREGAWPPGDDTHVEAFQTGGGLVLDPNKSMADLGVVLPPSVTPPERDEWLLLHVNNDEMLVINKTKMPGAEVMGEGGGRELLVYDKKLQRWSTVRFPGAGSAVRGFGRWLVLAHANVRRTSAADLRNDWRNEQDSPGSDRRRQTRVRSGSRVQDGGDFNVDDLFRRSRYYYPGILYLYDARSRKRYQIQTDQGDSEVLLVEGDTVYYRVNQTLYSATIGTSGVGKSTPILSDEIVQLSHWAFIGPPASP